MKKCIVIVICLMMAFAETVSARKQQVEKMYMFGFAAAFTDTIVHFTNIQMIDSAWIESKNHFLQGREDYSIQLRDYLRDQLKSPNRTCIVFYSEKRDKLEKKYQKMMRLYGQDKNGNQHFDVRYITDMDFKFTTVMMEDEEEPKNE